MRIAHVVLTDAFAGTERYVFEVAALQAGRGHHVTVVGGPSTHVPDAVTHVRATDLLAGVRGLQRTGPHDVVHAHLTSSELAALAWATPHRVPVVSTRHIAARRGSSLPVRLLSPLVDRRLAAQLAISDHVAASMRSRPTAVLHNGVRSSDLPYDSASRRVLVLQRLEAEKHTELALEAWRLAGLVGWELVIAGDGVQRAALEAQAGPGVTFLGLVDDVQALLGSSALLLATAPSEPFGLSVLEAMAQGVPVLAARGGGHLESLGPDHELWFEPGDAAGAAAALRQFVDERHDGEAGRSRQRERFDIVAHVHALLERYAEALAPVR